MAGYNGMGRVTLLLGIARLALLGTGATGGTGATRLLGEKKG